MDVFVVKPVSRGRGVVEVSSVRLLPLSSANKVSEAPKDTHERAASVWSGRCEQGTLGRLSEFSGLMTFVKGRPTLGGHDAGYQCR
jgi:hypothetical protein